MKLYFYLKYLTGKEPSIVRLSLISLICSALATTSWKFSSYKLKPKHYYLVLAHKHSKNKQCQRCKLFFLKVPGPAGEPSIF